MRIRLLSSAFNDLVRGRNFYEQQGDGLGGYFLDSLFSDIDSLMLYAGIHRKVFSFPRLSSKRFPHAIYYRLETENEVVVYHVLDCRQNPHEIHSSLKTTNE
jgi:hypothetical protein